MKHMKENGRAIMSFALFTPRNSIAQMLVVSFAPTDSTETKPTLFYSVFRRLFSQASSRTLSSPFQPAYIFFPLLVSFITNNSTALFILSTFSFSIPRPWFVSHSFFFLTFSVFLLVFYFQPEHFQLPTETIFRCYLSTVNLSISHFLLLPIITVKNFSESQPKLPDMSQVLHHSQLYPQRFATTSEPVFPDSRDTASIGKKRRGRQPRQSLLTSNLRNSIARFTAAVGCPVLQPAGFRDFNGWLQVISQPSYKSAWHSLCRSFISESAKISSRQIPTLKRDVIHEIINNVVKRKSHESAKLISTNARRQSTIPPSGHTVMTIFESYLATVSSPPPADSYISSSVTPSRQEKYHSQHSSTQSPVSTIFHHPIYQSPTLVFQNQPDSYFSKKSHSPTPSPTHCSSRDASIASLSPKSSRSSSRTSSGSPRAIAASNMDISSLLIDDYEAVLSRKQSSYRRSSTSRSKLPSLSQFDEQIRQRSVKERFY